MASGGGGGVRYLVERTALGITASMGLVVLLADLLGWLDELAPGATLSKITLLILSTVTVFLLFEIDRLKVLDNVNERLSKIDIEGIAEERTREHFGGVNKVHEDFPAETFTGFLGNAGQEVAILQTWIPNLHRFESSLRAALVDRRVRVRILLLHPASRVAQLRDEALRAVRDSALEENVRASVERSLSILSTLHGEIDDEARDRLEVRVYNSLPSVAVYKADERYLVSWFLHGRLAIDSPQMEIHGSDTVVGRAVQEELDKLWRIGRDVDLRDWRSSVDTITL